MGENFNNRGKRSNFIKSKVFGTFTQQQAINKEINNERQKTTFRSRRIRVDF